MIYGRESHYIGVCFELGLVEEGKSLEEVENRLHNGARAIVATCVKENLSDENFNTNPPLKYRLLFYIIPILFLFFSFVRQLRDFFTFRIFNEDLSDLTLCEA